MTSVGSLALHEEVDGDRGGCEDGLGVQNHEGNVAGCGADHPFLDWSLHCLAAC